MAVPVRRIVVVIKVIPEQHLIRFIGQEFDDDEKRQFITTPSINYTGVQQQVIIFTGWCWAIAGVAGRSIFPWPRI
ncbi:MAG: hypothetical protein IT448_12070 [Phycisphaerales bacterium]|nr:hypothetical protein [Phycisphaerales bacterium]